MKRLIATLKTMSSRREKIDYIWEYYKLHIIGSVSAVLFLYIMIGNIFGEEEKVVEIMVVSEASLPVIEQVEEDLSEHSFEAFTLYIEYIQHKGGKIEENAFDQMQKMSAAISVGQIDIMITDETLATQLIEEDLFLPLSEVIDLKQLNQEQYQLIDFGTNEVYGISTKNIAYFDDESFNDTFILIPATSSNLEYVQSVMDVLLP
ncbi:hypothetical protein [Paraliobacillus zengyii]|uniref:hypothetical protein n=1 Tax=Paraliobacillus zengyii TaxID=2213194 RepID=UPI000E3B634C|nr:hypothetical protein [Paraliobacillus zengyii]